MVVAAATENGQQPGLSCTQPMTGAHRYAVERSRSVHSAVEHVPVRTKPEPCHCAPDALDDDVVVMVEELVADEELVEEVWRADEVVVVPDE